MHVPDSGIENVHMFWNMCEYSMPLQNATYRDVMMDVINHYLRFQDSKETCLTRTHATRVSYTVIYSYTYTRVCIGIWDST
jgi:hypothetical protein